MGGADAAGVVFIGEFFDVGAHGGEVVGGGFLPRSVVGGGHVVGVGGDGDLGVDEEDLVVGEEDLHIGDKFLAGFVELLGLQAVVDALGEAGGGEDVFEDELFSEIDYDDDSDGDGLPDVVELSFGSDPLQGDTDRDGLSDRDEYLLSTDPRRSDSDRDGMPDGWEVSHGLDPLLASGQEGTDDDPDSDGLTNLGEYLNN